MHGVHRILTGLLAGLLTRHDEGRSRPETWSRSVRPETPRRVREACRELASDEVA
jgi:hypothetical protein